MTAVALRQPRLLRPHVWTPGSPLGMIEQAIGAALDSHGIGLGRVEGIGSRFADRIGVRGGSILRAVGSVAGLKLLDHVNGKTSYTLVTPNYIALLTATALPADTGVTITTTNNVEATYTSYARLAMAATDYPAASAGANPPTGTVSAPVGSKTWPNCTGGTNVITNWCFILGTSTARANAGDMTFYGTCTSTTISVTQTPPTVAANGFTLTDT